MLIRPRYRRPFATTNRFSVTFTTAMPRSGSVRVLSGFTRRTREESAESGKTTQRTPAGTDPTATPLPASLTNSSPPSGPPIDAFANPTARPIRSSGSPPAGCGPGDRRGHAAVARTTRLASCFAQRGIQLLEGEVDVRLGVRARDKARLERRRREEDATSQ